MVQLKGTLWVPDTSLFQLTQAWDYRRGKPQRDEV